MVFGDPYVFAISIDRVHAWSSERFHNGLLSYFADGMEIGAEIKNATMEITMMDLEDCIINLDTQHIDAELAHLTKREAFAEVYERTCALKSDSHDYSYLAATTIQRDVREDVFLLKTHLGYDRLLFGIGFDINNSENIQIQEVRVPTGVVINVMRQAVQSWRNGGELWYYGGNQSPNRL